MIDRYTQAVLTVIACSLSILVFQNFSGIAEADGKECGTPDKPCFVTISHHSTNFISNIASEMCGSSSSPCFVAGDSESRTRHPLKVIVEN